MTTAPPTVMVVEDDAPLRGALAASLHAHGYEVIEASSAEECVVVVGYRRPSLVLLDLSLPGKDGFHALTRLRSFSDVPVIVLTVRDGKHDKVMALDGGADDYVTKPFDADELLARVRAALRRSNEAPDDRAVRHVGDLTIDLARSTVVRAGTPTHLTATEMRFLELLVRSEGRLLTHAQVAEHLANGEGRGPDARALRVHVAQLRKKLGDDAASPRLIVTQYGLGYRWIAAEAEGGRDER